MRKGHKSRPYDEAVAVERAARCRALRERAGLNRDALARIAGVTERSAGRWEDESGAGNCPDDVLELLECLIDRQADLVSNAVGAIEAGRVRLDGPSPDEACISDSELETGASVSDFGSRIGSPGGPRCIAPGGPGELNQLVYPGLAPGGDRGRKTDPPKPISMPGGGPGGGAMPLVTLLYYPSQRCYELCHANDSTFYGVANANARAIAQELERLGFGIEWRYATPELLEDFPFDYV